MRVSLALLSLSLPALARAHHHFSIPDVSPGTYHRSLPPNTNPNSSSSITTTSAVSNGNGKPPTALAVAEAHLLQLAPNATFRSNGDSYMSAGSNITHVYFTQTVHGLDVANAHANVNVQPDGSVLSAGTSFVPATNTTTMPLVRRQQLLTPVDALQGVVESQNYPMGADAATVKPKPGAAMVGGNAQSYVIHGTQGTLANPKADLVYYATADGLKLSWRLETDLGSNWMITFADAQTKGLVHGAVDYVADSTFTVFEFGKTNDPGSGERVQVADPFSRDASPKGWQMAGEKTFTTTQGNNAIAQENPTGGDDYVNNYRPDGGSGGNFDFPYDKNAPDPHSYRDASIAQLYYTTNMFHDLLEELGFDEAAGNFEDADDKPCGKGNDAVQVNAQDGGGRNNANFGTPPDGERPRMNMFLWDIAPGPMRDGSFDETIVTHEYAHGLSTRLTGGPASSICLDSVEGAGLGEGWSDFYAVAVQLKPTDSRTTNYEIGTWVAGRGIRPYPYSTSTATNPTHYSTINTPGWNEEPHQIGAVWAGILYEVLWNLHDKHGYDENVFPTFRPGTRIPTAGRQLAMKLVLDGMKLQPCKPTFLTARDAIVDADKALTGGENLCALWRGFAKRGLGADAQQGLDHNQRVDGFRLPEGLDCSGEDEDREGGDGGDDDDDDDDDDDKDDDKNKGGDEHGHGHGHGHGQQHPDEHPDQHPEGEHPGQHPEGGEHEHPDQHPNGGEHEHPQKHPDVHGRPSIGGSGPAENPPPAGKVTARPNIAAAGDSAKVHHPRAPHANSSKHAHRHRQRTH